MTVPMMRHIRILLPLLFSVLIASCEVKMPEEIIPPARMEALLYDYHLVQSMSSEYASIDYKEKLYFEYVFNKHGVSKEDFEHSMEWYNRYPKHLQKIYANLEKRVEAEVESLSGAGVSQVPGVSIETAFLDTDTAELWSGAHNMMLYSSTLNSYLTFGFETPKDTSFVAGDSISFTFNALFVDENREGVGQRAHAGLFVMYDDGTSDNVGTEVKQGDCSLSVKRNCDSRMKSVSGFVYYADDDSLAKAKMMLGNISVKKIRVKESAVKTDKKK